MMNITLQPMKVEDYLGRKHVRGVYATQEVFQVDMLNRVLLELSSQSTAPRISSFLAFLWEDALASPLGEGRVLDFDAATQTAYAACVKAHHSVAALSLLRLARMEQVMLEVIRAKLPPGIAQQALILAAEYTAPDFELGLGVDGDVIPDTVKKVFEMTADELLNERPEIHWYFGESLNIPYAVQADLLPVARLILAKCYVLRALDLLYGDQLTQDGYYNLSGEISRQLDVWRYEYVFRQTQFTFVALSGFPDGQYGMSREEAHACLQRRMMPSAA